MLCSKRIPQQKGTIIIKMTKSHICFILSFLVRYRRGRNLNDMLCSKRIPQQKNTNQRNKYSWDNNNKNDKESHLLYSLIFLVRYRRGKNSNDMLCSKRIPQQKDTIQRNKYSQDENNKNDKESHLLYSLNFSEVQKREELKWHALQRKNTTTKRYQP